MCCLFGLIDTRNQLTGKQKNKAGKTLPKYLFSVPQALSYPFLCPVQCAADAAFVDAPFACDGADIFALKVVGKDSFTLQLGQFLRHHAFDAF